MSCCNKQAKSEAAEAGCCRTKRDEKGAATPEQASKSGCGCDTKRTPEKKEENKESSCC
jgi:hypothetical protein